MSDIAIHVENLGKAYHIGSQLQRGGTASQRLLNTLLRAPYQRLRAVMRAQAAYESQEVFWALRDLNFDIRVGEVVGVIGRNGAGKSTLLKILSQITSPTEGGVDIYGRVGSLLEVGTGFHPEMTGRQNIYMNGTILGMSRAEIDSKFDEIVAFSGVEKFLDTPVKRYSSGMTVRLAFAVAAHIEPEILLVDEVLAVGDAEFQKKSLGKMSSVAQSGRTILFVSHNMGMISRLCEKCILLEQGRMVAFGPTQQVIDQYISSGSTPTDSHYQAPPDPSKPIHVRHISYRNQHDEERTEFRHDEPIHVVIDYDVNETISNCQIWLTLNSIMEEPIFSSADYDTGQQELRTRQPGHYRSRLVLPAAWLNTTSYSCIVGVSRLTHPPQVYDRIQMPPFSIIGSTTFPSDSGADRRKGLLKPLLDWQTFAIQEAETLR